MLEAVASYDQALAINPDYVDALNNQANALDRLGQPQDALASVERALALEPDHVGALVTRSRAVAQASPLRGSARELRARACVGPTNARR